MGRRQVVRHLVLVQTFGGSNPSAPVNIFKISNAPSDKNNGFATDPIITVKLTLTLTRAKQKRVTNLSA